MISVNFSFPCLPLSDIDLDYNYSIYSRLQIRPNMRLKVVYTRELFSARQTAQVGTANLCEQEGALSKDG